VTHPRDEGYEYRYALLGAGELTETPVEGVLTDGTTYHDDGDRIVTEDGVTIARHELGALQETEITDDRQRWLFCNGAQIGGKRQYDGIYCCGEFAMCVYVEDEYLSGWEHTDEIGNTTVMSRKYTANPGWGDRKPPAAKDRAEWDRYKALYPGFVVDVFYKGAHIGKYKLNDANSPIFNERLFPNRFWRLFAAFRNIGSVPWVMEGSPGCAGSSKLLIPHDGGITTIIGGNVSERQLFP
jgi:hypothetical protein